MLSCYLDQRITWYASLTWPSALLICWNKMISRTEMLISSQITLFSPPTIFREVTLRYLFCHHREDLSGPLHPVWRNKNYFLSYRFLDTQASRSKTTFNWMLFGVDKFLNILRSHIPCVKAIDGQGSCDPIPCSRLSVDDSVLPSSDWGYIILWFDYQNSWFNVRILEL